MRVTMLPMCVCVYVCMCVYVCVYVCMCVCVCVCVYVLVLVLVLDDVSLEASPGMMVGVLACVCDWVSG